MAEGPLGVPLSDGKKPLGELKLLLPLKQLGKGEILRTWDKSCKERAA